MKKKFLLLQVFFICLFYGHAQNSNLLTCRDSNTVYSYFCDKPFRFSQILPTADGGHLTWGGLDNISGYYKNIGLFKTDITGKVQWVNKLAISANTVFDGNSIKITESANGHFIISGMVREITDEFPELFFLACLDSTGHLLWYKFLDMKPVDGQQWQPNYIVCTTDANDDIFVSLPYNTALQNSKHFNLVGKFSASGLPIWNRAFLITANDLLRNNGVIGMFVNQDTVTLIGSSGVAITPFVNMQLRSEDASIIQIKAFKPTGYLQFPSISNVNKVGDKYIGYGGNADGTIDLVGIGFHTIIFDLQLNPVKSFHVKTFVAEYPLQGSWDHNNAIATPDGGIIYSVARKLGNSLYYARLDGSVKFVVQKKLQYTDPSMGNFYWAPLGYSVGNKVLVRAYPITPVKETRFDYFSLDRDLSMGNNCFTTTDTSFMQLIPFEMKPIPFNYDFVQDDVLKEAPLELTEEPTTITMQEGCKEISTCHSPIISGPDSVCVSGGEAIFTASKGEACTKTVLWDIDPNAIQSFKKLNDSAVAIRFKTNWTGYLFATINSTCALKDSFKITAYDQKAGHLFTENASICSNQVFVLDAGEGFASYHWSTGETSQTIQISRKGQYHVNAFLSNGCFVRDSFELKNVFPAPLVNLPSINTLCKGFNDTLDAGEGQITYQWQDGSANRFFSVTEPGKYWVEVTDKNGCMSSDTVNFLKEASIPKDFLPSDTIICADQVFVLVAQKERYTEYYWNNNSTLPSLTVNAPGIYWLTVTDTNGCQGRDSIRIQTKNCPTSFYVPNAFTPNDDGRNDIFKPFITGLIDSYHFRIYNRPGQLVFHSTDLNVGWNGKINQAAAQAGTYVWICEYRFMHQQAVVKKGTVVLLR